MDEAHLYKNLQVSTRLSRTPGVSTAFSGRAFDMWMKTRYFNERTNHRGVVLATGTPIANAVGELNVMQQYLQSQRPHPALRLQGQLRRLHVAASGE